MNRFPNCYGKDRLSCPISIVQGVKSSEIVKKTTLGELLKDIQSVTPLSLELNAKLQDWYKSSPPQYKEQKEQLSAFIVGDFSKREDSGCLTYAPLLIFDIDKIEDTLFTAWILLEFQKCPYVFAAFTSVSGHGLRVMVWCDATAETHKEYYESICKYLSEFTGIKTDKLLRKEQQTDSPIERIDTGTNNVSRLWFYTPISKDLLYLNLDSQVFKLSEKPQITVPTPLVTEKLDESDKVKQLIDITRNLRIAGGRNNFVFTLACLLNEHGINQDTIFSTCYEFQEADFREKEIKRTVESALKHSKYGKYANKPLKLKKEQVQQSVALLTATESDNRIDEEDISRYAKVEAFIKKHYDIRFNTVARELEVSTVGKNDFKHLDDFEFNDLLRAISKKNIKVSEKTLATSLFSSFTPRYNPFVSYFEALPAWKEGDIDYISLLASYVKAKDPYWFKIQFKKALVRAIACAIGLLPFNKHCVVLHGKQNDGKSTFIRFLCPLILIAYLKENFKVDKDGLISLCQNFIINLDEIDTMNRGDLDQIKSLFATDSVKERLPYARTPIKFKRTASFFGSTNKNEFLTDETGNVRWLIIEIDGIDFGYSQVDINQVWAQAYALLKSGFDYQLTKDEVNQSEQNNQKFKRVYMELELLQENFEPSEKDAPNACFMSSSTMLNKISVQTNLKLNVQLFSKALAELGFKKISQRQPRANGTTVPTNGFYVLEKNTL